MKLKKLPKVELLYKRIFALSFLPPSRLTKVEAIRQRKCSFSSISLFRQHIRIIFLKHVHTSIGGVYAMKTKDKENKQQSNRKETAKPGYGDKKLNGPDRPST